MIAEELQIIIDAKVAAAVRDMKKVDDQLGKTEKSAADMAKAFVKQGIAVAGAAVSVGAMVKGVKAAISAFGIQEQAENALQSAIIATGKESEISAEKLGEYASALQGVTLFGDETILSGQALLQSLADLNQEGLEKITPAVLDFAQGMGVDLQTAMTLVGKTLGSSTNALSRYGIEIDASASKAEKLEQLTAALESKFGGMAEAAAETASGGVVQLKNAFGDLLEANGEWFLMGAEPTVSLLKEIVTGLTDARNAANDYKDALKAQEEGVETADQYLLILEAEQKRLGKIVNGHKGVGVATRQAYEEATTAVNNYKEALEVFHSGYLSPQALIAAEIELAEQREESIKLQEAQAKELTKVLKAQGDQRKTDEKADYEERVRMAEEFAAEQAAALGLEEEAATQHALNLIALAEKKQQVLKEIAEADAEDKEKAKEELKQLQEAYEQAAEAVIISAGSMFEAFGAALAAGESFNDAAKEFAKSASVTVLRTLGERAAAEAAVLWAKSSVPVTGSAYIPSAAAMTAASAGAFTAAGAVSAYANGTDQMVTSPTLFLAGEKGPERLRIDPQPDNRKASGVAVYFTGDVYGAGGKDEFIKDVVEGIKKAQRERVA